MVDTDSVNYKVGVSIGRMLHLLERKQRFDLTIEKEGVEHAREICRQHKFSIFSVHYAGTLERIYGAPSYLPPEPEPQPPGTPVQVRLRVAA